MFVKWPNVLLICAGSASPAMAIVVSLVIHMSFLLVPWSSLHSHKPSLHDLPSIEVELGSFREGSRIPAIKRAKSSDAVRVPSQFLPQLTKQKRVMDPKTSLKDNVQESLKEKSVVLKKHPLAKKPSSSKDEERRRDIEKKKRQAFATLKKEEAMRRMLLEEARKKERFADVVEAGDVSQTMVQKKSQSSFGIGAVSESFDDYRREVQLAIGRYYSLPEVYRYAREELKSSVLVVLDARGNILSRKIEQSSDDQIFDELSLSIIDQVAPFPAPPKELVGREMLIHFDPFG